MEKTYEGPVIRLNRKGQSYSFVDQATWEEPLEIRVTADDGKGRSLSITMRTPGRDEELAVGFLYTEGIIKNFLDVLKVNLCPSKSQFQNTVKVKVASSVFKKCQNLQRNFYMTSSCGVCGKSSLNALKVSFPYDEALPGPKVDYEMLFQLSKTLEKFQETFRRTGGLHACALFNDVGELVDLFEDIGRHNALDKLIGHAFMKNRLPLNPYLLLLSGRVSFELMQKAAMAGLKFVCAIGAPSSLAIEMAKKFDITLVGFLKDSKYNIYHAAKRVYYEDKNERELPTTEVNQE